jgi:hypothetical protein
MRQLRSISRCAILGLGALICAPFLFSGLATGERPSPEIAAAPGAPQKVPAPVLSPQQSVKAKAAFSRLPLYFVENRGQIDSRVKFYEKSQGRAVWFTQEGVSFSFPKEPPAAVRGPGRRAADTLGRVRPDRGSDLTRASGPPAVVRLQPLGLQAGVKVEALEPQQCRFNYLIGSDTKKWRTDIPTYRAVVYREAYPGVDLKFYGTDRQMEYDIVVQPGADPGQVKFRYAGAEGLSLTPEGDLYVRLPGGQSLVQKKPVAYQEIAGQKMAREGKFTLHHDAAQCAFGFQVAAHDVRYPLVIDPILEFSTFAGGGLWDRLRAVALDQAENIYVAGATSSLDLPAFSAGGGPAIQEHYIPGPPEHVTCDGFIAKMTADGTALIYCTYLGGTGDDWIHGLAVGLTGQAYVTGYTESPDFPGAQNSKFPNLKGTRDAFAAKINATGSSLIYGMYLGGDGEETGWGIAVDPLGNAYVAGETTSSTGFPKGNKGLFTSYLGGCLDGFVVKINPGGTALLYATYLGGSQGDAAYAIAVDDKSNAYVTGNTASDDFPVEKPFQATMAGASDAFITKINAAGTALTYSTFFGGSQGVSVGMDIAVDQLGSAYVAGETEADNLPSAPDTVYHTFAGTRDVFVAKFDPVGSSLLFSTYLGGQDYDMANGIALDGDGNIYVAGTTRSKNFPVVNPISTDFDHFKIVGSNISTGFLARINKNLFQMDYSFYLGGSTFEENVTVTATSSGEAIAAGTTGSGDFPIKNPLSSFTGTAPPQIGFVTKVSPQTFINWHYLQFIIKPPWLKKFYNPEYTRKIQVAILSARDFDATKRVNPATVSLNGGLALMKKRGKCQYAYQDVNRDGLKDLVVWVSKEAMPIRVEGVTPQVTARTFDGAYLTSQVLAR